jgi:hypothetical protein
MTKRVTWVVNRDLILNIQHRGDREGLCSSSSSSNNLFFFFCSRKMAKTAKLRKQRKGALRRLTGAECSEEDISTTLSTLAKLTKNSSLLEQPQFALIREQLKNLSSKVVNPVTHVTQLLTELSFENAHGFILNLNSRVCISSLIEFLD